MTQEIPMSQPTLTAHTLWPNQPPDQGAVIKVFFGDKSGDVAYIHIAKLSGAPPAIDDNATYWGQIPEDVKLEMARFALDVFENWNRGPGDD
jgi:hypothetical protein